MTTMIRSAHRYSPCSRRTSFLIFIAILILGCQLPPHRAHNRPPPVSCADGSALQNVQLAEWLQGTTATLAAFRADNAILLRSIVQRQSAAAAASHTARATPSVLLWDEGDRFPTIVLHKPEGTPTRIRLDPLMRRNKLHQLSKIAISPDSQQIALAATSQETNTRTLLIMNRADSSSRLVPIAAHDAVWSDNQQLVASALVNQQPRVVYAIRPDTSPAVLFSAQEEHESLLLSQSRDGGVFFVTRALGNSSSVLAYRSHAALQPFLSVDIGAGPGRCTSWAGDLACILFTRSPHGQLVLFQNGEITAQTILFSGTEAGWLEDLDADSQHLAVFIRHGTNTSMKIFSRSATGVSDLGPLGPVTTLRPSAKVTNDRGIQVTLRSFLNPTQPLPLSAIPGAQGDQSKPLHAACPDCIEETLEVASSDGALVPISLARPKNVRGLLVLAYGSYGISQSAEFSDLHKGLLQRGFAIALAHVRGGSERGPGWSMQAKAANKTRSVADLIATIEFLQGRLEVPPSKTFLWGRSAGGWLVTKAATTKPTLIQGLLLEAPLLDIESAISDMSSPLVHSERLEWGTTASSALSVLPATPLPFHILLQIPLQDELISPLDTARWAIAAECAQSQGYTMLVEALSKAGHAGPDSRAEQTDWGSLQEAFLVSHSENF